MEKEKEKRYQIYERVENIIMKNLWGVKIMFSFLLLCAIFAIAFWKNFYFGSYVMLGLTILLSVLEVKFFPFLRKHYMIVPFTINILLAGISLWLWLPMDTVQGIVMGWLHDCILLVISCSVSIIISKMYIKVKNNA